MNQLVSTLDGMLLVATQGNFPSNLVKALRDALEMARGGDSNPAGTPGAKVDLSRLDASPWPQEAEPAVVRVARADLPPPFDSLEEAQRAAGTVPPAASYRVCVRGCESGKAGEVMFIGNVPDSTYPSHADWLPCDKDGWVSAATRWPVEMSVEFRGTRDAGRNPTDWRPVRQPTTGHTDAIPKPSALDEMAEQVRRWAVPTRECAVPGYTGPFRYEATAASDIDPASMLKPALAVQEGGSHYKTMKIQPVEYIHANGLGYFEGNVVKYVSRWRAKGGLGDLKKARHYLDLLIELEGGTK
jgi:hypothetical protein